MKALIIKELKSILCSSTGCFISLAFLGLIGVLLWLFDGNFNLLDNGIASLSTFFNLSPIILSLLIPALTMRQFAEERRNETLSVLKARPVAAVYIVISKYLATFVFTLILLLPTLIYVYSIYNLANPIGNIDLSAVFISYLSLLLIVAVFVASGLFASIVTDNPIVALVIGVVINLFLYFAFDLLATLFTTGRVQAAISSIGLYHHYELMHRGAIQVKDILVVINYIFLFILFTIYRLNRKVKKMSIMICLFIVCNIAFVFLPNYRADFTTDKRYTLSSYTQKMLADVNKQNEKLKVEIWLTGDLNAGFSRLQDDVKDLLTDFNRYANNSICVSVKSPEEVYQDSPAKENILKHFQLSPVQLNEVDKEGRASRKMIYPYALVSNGKDTLAVSLLKNIPGYSADENLNASAESLEFEFADAIRLINQTKPRQIAFIEGHGELPRAYIYDAEEQLAKYFFVNRGQIGNEVGILDQFAVVIIAGPVKKYTEQEKYIIDQYIMSGGKVLWLLDGAYYSHADLVNEGHSASMKNDVNLDDVLFTYGVRINPDFVQDKQCSQILLLSGNDNNAQSPVATPCFYMPLLMPSHDNVISRGIRDVKAAFVSSIDIVNKSDAIIKSVLLTTSQNSHLVRVPETIDFDVDRILNQPDYFNQPFIPVAVSLEGRFSSAFANRIFPDSIKMNGHQYRNESLNTKMVFVATSDIIRNEIEGQGENSNPLPLGFDRVSGRMYGNREFIVNAVNWLTDDTGLMQLRSKQQQLHVLNRQALIDNRNFYIVLNICFPLVFILALVGIINLYRKRKYEK